MKTVIHLIEQLSDFGGTPRKLLYLAAHTARNSNDLVFVTYRPSSLAPAFREQGAAVINLDTMSAWKIGRHVAQIARARGAVAICTHFTRPMIAGFAASRLTGLPWLHNEHSSASYRKGAGHVAARLCLPFAEAIVCNSHHTARSLVQGYGLDSSRLTVLHNPVEKRLPNRARQAVRTDVNTEPDALVIGHVGGMIATRDQGTLLKAFQRIHQRVPRARLWLIGDGPLRTSLEQLAAELGIRDSVRFIGYTDQVGDYLHAMDLYVNPTLDEGFGIAVVEAMLAGLPVVLADAGAHPELIVGGEQGLLYAPADVNALVAALQCLVQQPDYRKRLGQAAAESAARRFAPRHYADGYDELIDRLLAARSQQRAGAA